MADLKFRMPPGASGADLSFQLLQEEEDALSATEEFADRDACLAAIREAAKALNEEQPFAIRDAPGGQVLELSVPDERALARSKPLSA